MSSPSERRGHQFSAALCRGLIEAAQGIGPIVGSHIKFSAALCRGLIEARSDVGSPSGRSARFPRLYAAASLKPCRYPGRLWRSRRKFSAALCRGLIEAPIRFLCSPSFLVFSAALCRGLIEAPSIASCRYQSAAGFPRLYAAASLKPATQSESLSGLEMFSAALCRGLIEAISTATGLPPRRPVFRGFMPRPH